PVAIKERGGQILFQNKLFNATKNPQVLQIPDLPELEMLTSEGGSQDRELLTILAHQLRTPLTGVLWNAELASETSDKQTSEYVENISVSGRKLQRTVRDLLIALEMEHSLTKFAPKQISLTETIVSAASGL